MSAAVVSAAASAAALSASRARDELCKVTIQTYQPNGASIAEMKQYAECVQRIYPDAMTDQSIIYAKGAIVLMFAAMVIGAWRMREDGWINGVALGALVGLGSALFCEILLVAAFFAIRFLLT